MVPGEEVGGLVVAVVVAEEGGRLFRFVEVERGAPGGRRAVLFRFVVVVPPGGSAGRRPRGVRGPLPTVVRRVHLFSKISASSFFFTFTTSTPRFFNRLLNSPASCTRRTETSSISITHPNR